MNELVQEAHHGQSEVGAVPFVYSTFFRPPSDHLPESGGAGSSTTWNGDCPNA